MTTKALDTDSPFSYVPPLPYSPHEYKARSQKPELPMVIITQYARALATIVTVTS